MKNWLEKQFRLSEFNTNIKTELLAGLTTFVTMAYVLATIPNILAGAGYDKHTTLTAMIILIIVTSCAMALVTNRPFALAPGLGSVGIIASMITNEGVSMPIAAGVIFWSGVLFIIISFFGLREAVVRVIPVSLKQAVSAGIGLFIALLGAKNCGLIVANDAKNCLSFGDLASPSVIVAVIGFLILLVIKVRNIPGGIEENKERLISIYEKTDLERAALIDKNGDAYYDNGVTKNVSHRRYFQEAISGAQTISDPLESSVDHKVRVVLGVPVYKDHKVIGVLGGSCNVTALSHMLFNDLFDGAGNSLLATSDGEIIAFDSGSASGTEITYGINLFKYYGEKNLKGKHALQDIQEDFKVGESGLVKLSLKERKEADRYLAYMPLGYNDWMICYAIPVKSAQQAYEFISGYEILFMGSFCILVLLLLLYIVVRNNQEKAELVRSAQKDALTGVYNRENTQKVIDAILREKAPEDFHGFLILDMDHFKEVNDVYGHVMGDNVLKMLGGFLKEQFREQDVIGRIGGDEFVILLCNIGSRENMESRIKKLHEKLREIRMEGMGEHTFTFSAGIAFAPQDGDTFMELYQKADFALYQVKRSGRDGYRIYK